MKKTTRKTGWLLLLGIGLGACGDGSSDVSAVLTRARVADAAACATGGTVIESGTDANRNGMLEDTEVAQTTPVCNGTTTQGPMGSTGQAPLIASSDIPPGDPACPNGGSRLRIGYDDGAGGGTAGDGVLQDGEVDTNKAVCNFSGTPKVGSLTPPAAPAGAYTIQSIGGNSGGTTGANSGVIEVAMSQGSVGGHVKVFRTGAADASFTVPTAAFIAGSDPVVINADTILKSYNSPALGITSGDPVFLYYTGYWSYLYKNVAGEAKLVTSLDVAAGVTLTFPQVANAVRLLMSDCSVRNAGTITTARHSDTRSGLELWFWLHSYVGAAGSTFNNGGNTVGGGIGGNGGSTWIWATMILNQGTIRSAGGDGNTAGYGGAMWLRGFEGMVNIGTLDTHGGNAAAGIGAAGGSMTVWGYYKRWDSSGTLDTHGGNGTSGSGSGGSIDLVAGATAAMHLGGVLNSKGGTCSVGPCAGGVGGNINIVAQSTNLFQNASLDASGGNGLTTGTGGAGGQINVSAGQATGYNGGADLPAGTLQISGNILSQGGNGNVGGVGGSISLRGYGGDLPNGQELILLGYTDIKTRGGDSAVGLGGRGYYIYMYNNQAYTVAGSSVSGPGGSVLNYADLTTQGGNGLNGGRGYGARLYTQTSYYYGVDFEKVINHGAITSRGGTATTGTGGPISAPVYLAGIAGVENDGALTSRGGDSTGTLGGSNGRVELSSDYGPVNNKGAIDVTGGSATNAAGTGGYAGYIQLTGAGITNTAALTAKGGAGGAATSGTGGSGGTVELTSFPPGGPTNNTGTVDVSGGAGFTTTGNKGTYYKDGVNVTP